MKTLYKQMEDWLDAEEGRSLMLVSANADFEGPSHCIGWSDRSNEFQHIYGESREECFAKIVASTDPPPMYGDDRVRPEKDPYDHYLYRDREDHWRGD